MSSKQIRVHVEKAVEKLHDFIEHADTDILECVLVDHISFVEYVEYDFVEYVEYDVDTDIFSRPTAWRLLTKDYYKVLGVNRTITTDELTKRYKQLSRRYHPDLNKTPGAIQKFKEVREAFDGIMKERK